MIRVPFDCLKYDNAYSYFKLISDWLRENVKDWKIEEDSPCNALGMRNMYSILVEDEETVIMLKLRFNL